MSWCLDLEVDREAGLDCALDAGFDGCDALKNAQGISDLEQRWRCSSLFVEVARPLSTCECNVKVPILTVDHHPRPIRSARRRSISKLRDHLRHAEEYIQSQP